MSNKKKNIINRKQYEKIKKMDRYQMALWAESFYQSAYQEGMKDAEGLTIDEVKEALLHQKGIGEKRANAIIRALEQKMNEKCFSGKKLPPPLLNQE